MTDTPHTPSWGDWSSRSEHIFIKEVVAAVRTIKWLARKYPDGSLHIVLLVDNIAARRALERGYSSNRAIAKLSWRLWAWADANDIELSFLDCASEYNVADCITRDWGVWANHEKDRSHNQHARGHFCNHRVVSSCEILLGLRAARPLPAIAPHQRISRLDIPDDEEDDGLDISEAVGLLEPDADEDAVL